MKLSIEQAYGLFTELRTALLASGYLTLEMKKELEHARRINVEVGWRGADLAVRNFARDRSSVSLEMNQTPLEVEVAELYGQVRHLELIDDNSKIWLDDVLRRDDHVNADLIIEFTTKLSLLAEKIDSENNAGIQRILNLAGITVFQRKEVFNGIKNVERWVLVCFDRVYILGNPEDE